MSTKFYKSPLVTIAIPIYNSESYLRDAIQSCFNQTFKDWELLLMCDGSTDNSNIIVYEMACLDKRVKVIDDKSNRGLVYRLNQSINLAKGKYYARMDADDIMAVDRIQKQVAFLEANPEVDVVGSSMMLIDGENNIIGSSYMKNNNSFVHPSVMGKTKWFHSYLYDEKALRAEDFDLWNRTRRYSCFANIDQPLLFYRSLGMPALRKILQSYRTMQLLHLRYKEYGKNWIWGYKYYVLFFVKIIALRLLALFDMQNIVIKCRRYISVPVELSLTKADLKSSIVKSN